MRRSLTDPPPPPRGDVGLYLTAGGFAIAALLLIFPGSIQVDLGTRILLLVLVTAAFPGVLYAIHAAKRARLVFRRGLAYDELARQIQEKDAELTKTKVALNALLEERNDTRHFEIICFFYYKERIYLKLALKRGIKLEEGDLVMVIDRLTSGTTSVLGHFVIAERSRSGYTAKSIGDLDPILAGYIHQAGAARFSSPPGTRAIALR